MTLESWVNRRFHNAWNSLIDAGIPDDAIYCELEQPMVSPAAVPCRACADYDTIWIAKWWTGLCYAVGCTWPVERLLRHELGHVLCFQQPHIRDHFELPEYGDMALQYVLYALRGFTRYGDTHPEEGFCEAVADLDPWCLRELAMALRG